MEVLVARLLLKQVTAVNTLVEVVAVVHTPKVMVATEEVELL
jgi:hypothetical protein